MQQAITQFRPVFAAEGVVLPETIRATIGWTSKGRRSTTIGECWYPTAVGDGIHELYVTPTITDAARVLDILAHELTHVAVGPEAKHGKPFRDLATAIGLEGRMTATVAGERMTETAAAIIDAIGPYPHAGILPNNGAKSSPPKQSTRMLKLECPGCGYIARTTQKWLDVGIPICPCGTNMQTAA